VHSVSPYMDVETCRVFQIMGKLNESVKIYDLSRMTDSLRAMRHGIRRTPVAVINGEKYEGLNGILRAIAVEPHT
jgi:hypothetical protein